VKTKNAKPKHAQVRRLLHRYCRHLKVVDVVGSIGAPVAGDRSVVEGIGSL
jgi:hypothetical protein